MGAVFRWIKYIYEWCKNFAFKLSGSAFGYYPPYNQGIDYYVDGINGDDDNDGKSWAKAVATIGQAITLNNATIDWITPPYGIKEYNTIWVRPGLYPEADLSFPMFCHLIGLGVHGLDTMVEIHPVAGSGAIFTDNSMASHLANLRMEIDDADTPIIDAGVFNSVLIEHCTFAPGAAVAGMTGIEMDDSHLAEIRDCSFESSLATALAYGIHCTAGSFDSGRIHDNVIFADIGICFDAGVNASRAVIKDNFIEADTIGIDDDMGASFLINNWIHADDAIDHRNAATRCIANHVLDGAVGAVEAADTD